MQTTLIKHNVTYNPRLPQDVKAEWAFWKEKEVSAMQITEAGQKQHIKKLLILRSLPTFLLSVGPTLPFRHQPLFYAPDIPSIVFTFKDVGMIKWSLPYYCFLSTQKLLLGLHLASRVFSIDLYNKTINRNYVLKYTLSNKYAKSYC